MTKRPLAHTARRCRDSNIDILGTQTTPVKHVPNTCTPFWHASDAWHVVTGGDGGRGRRRLAPSVNLYGRRAGSLPPTMPRCCGHRKTCRMPDIACRLLPALQDLLPRRCRAISDRHLALAGAFHCRTHFSSIRAVDDRWGRMVGTGRETVGRQPCGHDERFGR